ncbi:MAG: glycosyltransferase [Chitinivibrionales bacterium]|nr:glycosyltransferase [Chitinivibrionales bacterium]
MPLLKKSTRILFIINNLNRGGAELLLFNLCDKLKETYYKNYEIYVATMHVGDKLISQFKKLKIDIVQLKLDHSPSYSKLFRLISLIRRIKPNIVHTHLHLSDRYGLIAAFIAGVRFRVCTAHNMEPNRYLQLRITHAITSLLACKIVCVSNSAKQFYIQNRIYPSAKLHRIYNSPGFTCTKSTITKTQYPLMAICVDSLSEQKGYVHLLRALGMLDKKTSELLHICIYGEGNMQNLLQKMIDQNRLHNVDFRGNVNNIDQVMREANIYITSSLYEGFHMSLLEAMSVGLPLILTDLPPHRELMADIDDYPFWVSPGNSQELAGSICELVINYKKYIPFKNKIRHCARKFTKEKMVLNYNKLYSELID